MDLVNLVGLSTTSKFTINWLGSGKTDCGKAYLKVVLHSQSETVMEWQVDGDDNEVDQNLFRTTTDRDNTSDEMYFNLKVKAPSENTYASSTNVFRSIRSPPDKWSVTPSAFKPNVNKITNNTHTLNTVHLTVLLNWHHWKTSFKTTYRKALHYLYRFP